MHPGGRNGRKPAPGRRRRFKLDIDLLIEALQLASQRQQAEARQKLAVGSLGGAALAIARLVPQLGRLQDPLSSSASNSTDAPPRRAGGRRRC